MADQVAVTKVIEVDVKASAAAAAHLKQLADSMDPIQKSAEKAGNSLGQMLNWVKGFAVFQIVDMVADKVLAFATALQQASDMSRVLEERMKLVTASSTEASTAFSAIVEISIRQGRELDAVAKLYEKVQRNSEALALTQKGVATITEGVAASLRLSGASTQEANAAMLQFAQALASGKLGGDEFRSLMENNSVLMQNFAKELGISMGQLREWSKEGKLNAETLREAMLKTGEDGRNMMQRMIEQAEKLPKTFDQAVTGMKSALVELLNALQQTSEKSEGFFTKMVKNITESTLRAADQLRLYASINEEVAKLIAERLGKPVELKQEELSRDQAFVISAYKQREAAVENYATALNKLAVAERANRNNPNFQSSSEFVRLNRAIAQAQGTIDAIDKRFAEMRDKMNPALVTGEVKPGATVDNKPKGPKKDTAVDIMEDIQSRLEDEAYKLQLMAEGETKAASALEIAFKKIDAVPRGKVSDSQLEEFKERMRRQEAENEKLRKELEERADGLKRTEEFNKEVEREFERHQKEMAKIRDETNRDRLTQDPFVGAEAEVDRLRALLDDPRTSEEMKDIILDRMSQVRAKAAKQLLGEKDPLKTIPEQMADNWKTAFDRMEVDLLDFSKSAKDIAKDLVTSLLADFARLQLKQALQPLMQQGADLMKKGVESLITSFASADGSVWNQGLRMFQNGGVVDSPTGFSYAGGGRGVMGEAGPEAIMPLKRGSDGKLGVGTAPVEVNVYNNGSNTKTRTEQSTNSRGEQQINVIVEDMVEASLGGGRFDSVLSKSFAIQRKGS